MVGQSTAQCMGVGWLRIAWARWLALAFPFSTRFAPSRVRKYACTWQLQAPSVALEQCEQTTAKPTKAMSSRGPSPPGMGDRKAIALHMHVF